MTAIQCKLSGQKRWLVSAPKNGKLILELIFFLRVLTFRETFRMLQHLFSVALGWNFLKNEKKITKKSCSKKLYKNLSIFEQLFFVIFFSFFWKFQPKAIEKRCCNIRNVSRNVSTRKKKISSKIKFPFLGAETSQRFCPLNLAKIGDFLSEISVKK